MDLSPAPGFKRKPAASSSPSGEIATSPPPFSPTLSHSSPSSDMSSPLSTSSSVCASLSVYQHHVKGHTQGTEVAMVSSTSASLVVQSFHTPTSMTTCPDFRPLTLVQQSRACEEEGRQRKLYNPLHPAEGDMEVRMKWEEGEAEKYDPFDPTGSPASDIDDGSDKVGWMKKEVERADKQKKEEEPPDSTDTLNDLPIPCSVTQFPPGRSVDRRANKAGRQSGSDSDISEIEEGEIVGAVDRGRSGNRAAGGIVSLNSPTVSFFGSKPERILRVLDGDSFVSVCAEGSWEVDREPEDEPVVGMEDLRRKLVSRRKERYISFSPSPLSPQPPPPSSHPPASTPSSPVTPAKPGRQNHKSSKSSKDHDRKKSKDRKAEEKHERRKKRKKGKEGSRERSKETKQGHKTGKEVKGRRSSRSSSRKRKKGRQSSPEASRSGNSSGRGEHTKRCLSSLSEGRNRERERDKNRDVPGNRKREKEREQSHTSSHIRDEREKKDSNCRKKERERKGRPHSSSRERGTSERSKRSREKREGGRDKQCERDHRRDGRPVVPPSIQDLNGSDLFAIKRTITVTTTTTTTVPGSPRLAPTSPCRPTQDSNKSHKRKKRKWHLTGEMEEQESSHSRSQSLSPPRYHSYQPDHYSDKLEIDVLSLDGEAMDSDYPSLEETPPPAPPPEQPVSSPKMKTTSKIGRQHPPKKTYTLKKTDQSETSSSSRTKNKCHSSLTLTSGSATVSSGLSSVKRAKKVGKDKGRDKISRKDSGRSGKSKKEIGSSRKGKLQSKVSVLVREGVSSTTGASVGTGKLGVDLLGPGGAGGVAGGSVVGGSIAVVFCRDNESRSPFLKPCSEPLTLSSRNKELSNMGKRSTLAAPLSSLSSPAALKSKKTKPSSITSTSSSASSPSSCLATKRRRRLAKKTREKEGFVGLLAGDSSQVNAMSQGWGGASLDVQSAVGDGSKSVSPHTGQAVPAPCSSSSSSSSSTSVLPPSSSPPHTPPPSMPPLQDSRDSSPDSQTVDSSCKTPDPSFLAEDCPSQTSPMLPTSSPSSVSTPQGTDVNTALSTPVAKPLPDDPPKSLVSTSCSSSSAGCVLTSLSLPLSSSDPSSSSVSSSSATKLPLPPAAAPSLPWSLQTGVDCTAGGVLALTALLFKMEEANIASRAKAQEIIQATSQILSQANQSQSQQQPPPSSVASHVPPPPSLPAPPGLSPTQFILHSSLPLVGCNKTPPSHLHSMGSGCGQTPPSIMPMGLSAVTGSSSDTGWNNESKDPDKYLKKLHTQERAVEEVKLAIKPYYQRKDINKEEYKDILRKAVHKICHSRTGEINPVKVSNLIKLYVQRYKYFRKHGRKMDDEERDEREPGALHSSA